MWPIHLCCSSSTTLTARTSHLSILQQWSDSIFLLFDEFFVSGPWRPRRVPVYELHRRERLRKTLSTHLSLSLSLSTALRDASHKQYSVIQRPTIHIISRGRSKQGRKGSTKIDPCLLYIYWYYTGISPVSPPYSCNFSWNNAH